MAKPNNSNYLHLRRIAKELGVKVTGYRSAGKHFLVYLTTRSGKEITMTLSKAPMREGHVEFWVKREVRRAERAR